MSRLCNLYKQNLQWNSRRRSSC